MERALHFPLNLLEEKRSNIGIEILYPCRLCSLPTFRSRKKWSLQDCSLCYWLSSVSLQKNDNFSSANIAGCWSVSKTVASRPGPRKRPQNFGLERSRNQDRGLEDYKTAPTHTRFIQAPAQDPLVCSNTRQCWLQLWVSCTVVPSALLWLYSEFGADYECPDSTLDSCQKNRRNPDMSIAFLPTVAFLFFFGNDSTNTPDCLPILLSISVFLVFSFLFSTSLVVGSVR